MFFKKLFTKDYRHYLEKGEKFFQEERYADARSAFFEALQKLDSCGCEADSLQGMIRQKLAESGDRLGALNLAEAEHALQSGNVAKAGDHLLLVMELAEDVTLREKAERLLKTMDAEAAAERPNTLRHSCAGCSEDSGKNSQESHITDEHLATEDRYELYLQTLPADLPERYAGLGEKFAYGYLLNRDGDSKSALKVFEELAADGENDILCYEMALLHYRDGNLAKCEELLQKALRLNGMNPLCYFGLVQLLCETGRTAEAVPLLDHMIRVQLLADQARLMLGDVYLLLEDEDLAMENFSKLVASPNLGREAAQRLIPLLERHGRQDDAVYLAKRFAHGCC